MFLLVHRAPLVRGRSMQSLVLWDMEPQLPGVGRGRHMRGISQQVGPHSRRAAALLAQGTRKEPACHRALGHSGREKQAALRAGGCLGAKRLQSTPA